MGLKAIFQRGYSRRTQLLALSGSLLLAGGIGYFALASANGEKTPGTANPPPGAAGGERRGRPGGPGRALPVRATEARAGDLDIVVAALGTATAANTATVKARVDGQIVRINFREGQQVKAGDVLAEIDPRPFQIQLDQIRGQLQKDEALLNAARVDLERYRGLLGQDSIARQQVDSQEALVRQYQGSVETDKALLANARLNLDFTRITAPAAGRLGLRQVDVGNIVRSADSGGIAVITQTQPINVVFAIPAERLGNLIHRLQKGDSLTVEAWDRDNRTQLGEGRLRSVDNQIDVATGTIKLKAEFANRDDSLFANQFVNARLKVETRRNAVLLQSAAVLRNPQGTQVFVVGKEQTVEARPVRLGPANGGLVAIEEGLTAGEVVVLDGADRLQAGGKVEVLSIDGRALAGDEHAASGDGGQERRRRREGGEPRGERRQSAAGGGERLAAAPSGAGPRP